MKGAVSKEGEFMPTCNNTLFRLPKKCEPEANVFLIKEVTGGYKQKLLNYNLVNDWGSDSTLTFNYEKVS